MSIFDDALSAARSAVDATYARAMTVEPRKEGYSGSAPDPSRPSFDLRGVLHEFPSGSHGEASLIERSDGGRPGGRFGVDIAAAPIRVSFDLAALDGRHIVPGDLVRLLDGRRFEVTHAAPSNAGRQFFFVTEI